jgi:hypothetical protein
MEKVRHFDSRPIFVVYNKAEKASAYGYAYTAAQQTTSVIETDGQSSIRDEIEKFRKGWRNEVKPGKSNAT